MKPPIRRSPPGPMPVQQGPNPAHVNIALDQMLAARTSEVFSLRIELAAAQGEIIRLRASIPKPE